MNSALRTIMRTLEYAGKQQHSKFDQIKSQYIAIIDDYGIKMDGNRHPLSYHAKGRPCAIVQKDAFFAQFVPRSHKRKGRNKTHRWNHQKDPFALFIAKNSIKGLNKDGWFLIRYLQKEDKEFYDAFTFKIGSRIPDEIFKELQNKITQWMEKSFKDSYA